MYKLKLFKWVGNLHWDLQGMHYMAHSVPLISDNQKDHLTIRFQSSTTFLSSLVVHTVTTSSICYMKHINVNGEKNTIIHFPTNNILHALGDELKTRVIPAKSVDLA